MHGALLITSAAYVDQELAVEFGRIPPAFLPVGVSRLYEMQLQQFADCSPIYLTVPEGFTPQPFDSDRLTELGVTLVSVPQGLKLGESVVYAMNYIAAATGPIRILHGDTFIQDLPTDAHDVIAIHDEGDDYSWGCVNLDGERVASLDVINAGNGHDGQRPVACGYFAFSSSTGLIRAITRARGDFVAGLNLYAAETDVTASWVRTWRDFGHIQTYFRSRRAITTARSFNTLKAEAYTVRKSSDDTSKMRAEAHWLETIPPAVRPYSARLIDAGEAGGTTFYETEYLYAPTLSELFVFSAIGRPTWRNILSSCTDFLSACAAAKGTGSGDAILGELAVNKTIARLERHAAESGFDIGRPTTLDGRPLPSLLQIAEEMAEALDLSSGRAECVMHGDFCFSNILYNSRAARVSVIDPRGYVHAGQLSILGDTRYDLAKLAHSIEGNYDKILAGRYTLRQTSSHDLAITFESGPHHDWVRREFAQIEIDGVRAGSLPVRAATIGLFLSMLPLHADRPDRQTAFIANALRLYAGLQDATA